MRRMGRHGRPTENDDDIKIYPDVIPGGSRRVSKMPDGAGRVRGGEEMRSADGFSPRGQK